MIPRSGSKGGRERSSTTATPARSTAPAAREPIVGGAVHPAVSAREKPKTIRNRPTHPRTAPGQSIRGRTSGRLGGIQVSAPATAIAAKIKLTYNVQRHERHG